MKQSFVFIDVAGNQAEYTVCDRDCHDEFPWFTEHGDRGFAPSFEEAQYRARTVLKGSMEESRRSDEDIRIGKYSLRQRSH